MDTRELEVRLLAEGCSMSNFAINHRGSGSDLYCLGKKGEVWSVFYTERGRDSEPIFESVSEEEACLFYYDLMKKMDHWHLVGFFADEASALELQGRLTDIGVVFIRNDIPAYKHADDPRYRLFVVGEDIFKVRELLGDRFGGSI
ncbi:MAG: SPOR domain-containing protein [Akkermansiaceae bacterium]